MVTCWSTPAPSTGSAHGAVGLGAPPLVALVLCIIVGRANARGGDRNRFYRQGISYTCVIVGRGPIAAWAVLVLPGSF